MSFYFFVPNNTLTKEWQRYPFFIFSILNFDIYSKNIDLRQSLQTSYKLKVLTINTKYQKKLYQERPHQNQHFQPFDLPLVQKQRYKKHLPKKKVPLLKKRQKVFILIPLGAWRCTCSVRMGIKTALQ